MTLNELKAILSRRGLTLAMGETGPILRGPKHRASPALMEALQRRKEEIVAQMLAGPRCREWLWRCGGHTYREAAPDSEPHPVGAWWWRRQWDTQWQVVPGCEERAAGVPIPEPQPVRKSQPRKREEAA